MVKAIFRGADFRPCMTSQADSGLVGMLDLYPAVSRSHQLEIVRPDLSLAEKDLGAGQQCLTMSQDLPKEANGILAWIME
ncbi:hypothetical protein DUI87_21686 [Hirundo rustica rustica]|uniref:Uncharacterized protein n=1 Tax=Hirundo rustica rustica TaxID=333673 RepID=A0A3M0JL64_HIRRU|nr:hypothetical protein DUI87_21686 [Hirundo rustica rustica]